ncbi:MAG: dihydroxyacetone kinase subunit DhaL [Micrococcaceae bacterium]
MVEVKTWVKALKIFKEKIDENKDYLSELDTPIGDGDHGNNMVRGMEAVSESLEANKPETMQDVFKQTAMALISKVGGAAGPLYGTAMMEMGKAASSDQVIPMLEAGMSGIEKRGKSTTGEKTMLDLWGPAITAAQEDKLTNEVLEKAQEATKDMIATKGRASYLGERSVGHIDPGATSSMYFFQSLLEAGVFDE